MQLQLFLLKDGITNTTEALYKPRFPLNWA